MSNTSLLLFFALLPIVLILVTIYNIDRNKEPLLLLLIFFVLGILSCFAVIKLSEFLGNYLPFMNKDQSQLTFIETIYYVFIGVALLEELCKWIIVFILGYHNKEFDELYDVIVYSVFTSLGFAFFENIIYIFYLKEVQIAVLRALIAVPAHTCYAIFMGYYLSKAKQNKIEDKKNKVLICILLSIIIPTILHGIYDYCLMSRQNILVIVFIVFIVGLDIIAIQRTRKVILDNKKI